MLLIVGAIWFFLNIIILDWKYSLAFFLYSMIHRPGACGRRWPGGRGIYYYFFSWLTFTLSKRLKFKLWQPLVATNGHRCASCAELHEHTKSFPKWYDTHTLIRIKFSRAPRSFKSYLTRFSKKVEAFRMVSCRGQEIFPMECPWLY